MEEVHIGFTLPPLPLEPPQPSPTFTITEHASSDREQVQPKQDRKEHVQNRTYASNIDINGRMLSLQMPGDQRTPASSNFDAAATYCHPCRDLLVCSGVNLVVNLVLICKCTQQVI